jgi:hypothetical protein
MLDVGGLDSETRESLTWVRKPLAIGDELVIRVLGIVATTSPTRVTFQAIRSEARKGVVADHG